MNTMKFIAVVENKNEVELIAGQLREIGCKVEQVLKRTGVITGDSGRKRLTSLAIPGIRTVEAERKLSARKKTPGR